MTVAAPTGPSVAERIRSACARGGGAMLAVDGLEPVATPVHHLLDDGSFAITAPIDDVLTARVDNAHNATTGVPAMLELTDYAPLPLREPVRALVWVRGRLHGVLAAEVAAMLDMIAAENPDPALLQVNSGRLTDDDVRTALLRLEVDSVVAADSTGAESIGVGALLAARPDPFCALESSWVRHLEAAHRDIVDRLAARLPVGLRRGRVRPLGVDRYGVQLRVETDDADHDVRLPFTQPVDDVTGLSRAIRVLMGCPFLNGLHARRV